MRPACLEPFFFFSIVSFLGFLFSLLFSVNCTNVLSRVRSSKDRLYHTLSVSLFRFLHINISRISHATGSFRRFSIPETTGYIRCGLQYTYICHCFSSRFSIAARRGPAYTVTWRPSTPYFICNLSPFLLDRPRPPQEAVTWSQGRGSVYRTVRARARSSSLI